MKFSSNETLVWLCLLSNLIFAGSELISDYTGIDSWSIIYFGIGLMSVSVLILIYRIILKFKKIRNEKTNFNMKESKISLGAGIGLLAGIIIGSATDNVGLWIALGLCFGAGIGSTLEKKTK